MVPELRVTVAALLAVLVPVALSCQYQVTPEGALPLVRLVLPQLLFTEGAEGVPGKGVSE